MAALGAGQAGDMGSRWQTPPPPSAEQLGAVIQALACQASSATLVCKFGLQWWELCVPATCCLVEGYSCLANTPLVIVSLLPARIQTATIYCLPAEWLRHPRQQRNRQRPRGHQPRCTRGCTLPGFCYVPWLCQCVTCEARQPHLSVQPSCNLQLCMPPPNSLPADRELTSPSRLLTHDSTGSGSKQQAAKRRRTSAGPAGSAPHA